MKKAKSNFGDIFKFFSLAVWLFFLSGWAASCKAQTIDLSTDEAVIAELQKRADAKNNERANGDEKLLTKINAAGKLDAQNVCIRRFQESPKIIVIAFFRNDYGCHFEGAFVDLRFYDRTEISDQAKPTLENLGWQKADRTTREKLALWWTEKILHAFDEVFYPNRLNPAKDQWVQPPQTATRKNGDITVILWIQPPPDRLGKKSPQRFEYEFKSDGTFSAAGQEK